jgi:2-octaprenyl-6-methoxyphenol hydroxylase
MVRRARRELVAGNEVWIGNAAQSLHPVAGQGLNLGLRDAFELASVLGEARAGRCNLGLALERYRSRRRLDRGSTITLTDTLARIFSLAPLRPLQSVTLSAIDAVPAARTALARQFMYGLR